MAAEMEEFVRFLIEPIVADVSSVTFRKKRSRRGKNLVLELTDEDYERVSAGEGRIADALRAAADAWATKNGVRLRLLVRAAGGDDSLDEIDEDDDATQAEA